MYGLLLEGLRQFICSKYGEDQWNLIIRTANVNVSVFGTHDVYEEMLIPNITDAASKCLNIHVDDIMFQTGLFFINFVSHFGYDGILRVLGRDLRDFLNGLDNLHEYLRFSYPKLKPPSFFCVNESKTGITLQYRTKRHGYVHYVRGQITEIARLFYDTKMKVEVVSETSCENVFNCIMRLHFNNKTFIQLDDVLPVPSEVFFEVFPFNIIFNRGMKVIKCGPSIQNILPTLPETVITEHFILSRPLIDFTWNSIMLHTNNIFEIIRLDSQSRDIKLRKGKDNRIARRMLSHTTSSIRMRGQMKYMSEWDAIVFLGAPIMRDVDSMYKAGLFINDLSMHDSSRDLVLAGEQQSAELKLALEQESQKSKKLEELLKKLDEEMRKTDDLLFQMIPKSVAERLRQGIDPIDTCEAFNEVTILFSDIVSFTSICCQITPLEVVAMLNRLYSTFDELTEKHKVYKVETIGDAYMIVSGCPTLTQFHAPFIVEMALDMIEVISQIENPADNSKTLQIRIGIHTGMVVAGVVGSKMPRYCLFGDTVNTASMMESNSKPQKIHISDVTREKILKYNFYTITDREKEDMKIKTNTNTYWLEGRKDDNCRETSSLFMQLERERIRISDSNLTGNQAKGEGWESVNNSRENSSLSGRNSMVPYKTDLGESVIMNGNYVPSGLRSYRSQSGHGGLDDLKR